MKNLSKKLILWLLSFILCAFSFSCASSDTSTDHVSESTSKPSVTEAPKEENISDGRFHIISKFSAKAKIVYSERATEYEKELATQLQECIREKSGVSPEIKSDYVTKVEDASSKDFEILIGLTNRPESVKLNSELTDLTFAIQTTENKLVIVGKNAAMLSLGISYFTENIMQSDIVSCEKGNFSLTAGVKIISDKADATLKNYMNSGIVFSSALETIGNVASVGDTKVLGGACTDGEYFYAVMRSSSLDLSTMSYKSVVVKYELPSFTQVAVSEELDIGLGASIDYDRVSDRLVILHSSISGKEKVSYMTTKLLRITQTQTLSVSLDALCCVGDGTFIACDGENKKLLFLDNSLSVKESYDLRLLGGDIASVTTDGLYVYVLTNSKTMVNVYTLDGEYVNRITVDSALEAKNICFFKDELLVGFCDAYWTSGEIYRLSVTVGD